MERVLIISLKCLLLVNFLLFIGCGVESPNSTDLMKNETQELSSQDNCNKAFIDELSDSVLSQAVKETADIAFPISDSNENYTDAEILSNPKWLKKLDNDATYFINVNNHLNKERIALLKAKENLIQEGVVMSSCRLIGDGRLDVTFIMQKGVTSNLPNLVESYNKSIRKRNANYEEKLSNFQKDFEGTNFIIKPKKSSNKTGQNSIERKADKDYLRILYQSRIKYLLNISNG